MINLSNVHNLLTVNMSEIANWYKVCKKYRDLNVLIMGKKKGKKRSKIYNYKIGQNAETGQFMYVKSNTKS